MKCNSTLLCLLFIIAANSFTTAKAQAVDVNDSLALVDFYNSTDGSQWKNQDNWLTTKPVSTWYGVNLTDNRVTSLFLSSNKISGAIPASIGNLTQLTGLYLYDNQLSGTIPSSIGSLANLTTLSLSSNQLSGAIPSSVGNLIHLQYVDLYSNQLTGAIPASIGNLVNLWGLYLYNNKLTGTIPAAIGNLINLKELYLYNNQLSGAIPVTIGSLVYLTVLELNNNHLTDTVPSVISNLKRLQHLYLNNNNLGGTIPASLGQLKHLIALQLDHNQLSGSIPYSFRRLKQLSYLDLSDNLLSQYENVDFSSSVKFTSVSINHNLFTFNGLEFIAKKYFNIAYAPQNTVLPIHQHGNTLSVYAGGTLSNNTYKWFKAGGVNPTTIKGDSTFTPSTSGKYYAYVTNSIATKLTLTTDTFTYTVPLQSSIIASSAITASNHFSVYPNPATNLIHIQTNGTAAIALTNSAGKTLLTKTINHTADINVSSFANGTYYIQNKTTGEVQKIIVVH